MGLFSILKSMRRTDRAVFSTKDIALIQKSDDRTAKVYAKRMIEKGMLLPIERGKYSITNDPFIVASQLIFPSYISFLSALYLHGKTEQTVSRIFVATSKRKKNISVFGNEVNFVRLPPAMMFGYRKTKKSGSYIVLADPEKAVIDILYKPFFGPISYVADMMAALDIKKFEKYALKTNSEAVIRRAGFLLDRLDIAHSLKRNSYNTYKLNPRIRSKGKLDKKWGLFVNEVLE